MVDSVTFLLGPKTGHYPTAFMRGRQLKELVEPAITKAGLAAAIQTQYTDIARSIVIMNKTFLQDSTTEEVSKVRAQGNILVMDPVDMVLPHDKLGLADALIASSAAQRNFFAETFGDVPIFYLPHHVDLRLAAVTAQQNYFAAGYFGEPENGLHMAALHQENICDLIPAQSPQNALWMSHLPRYNCHYLIRNRRPWDGYKPFIKGFTAAHCGAVVVVEKRDAEAALILGPEYPFCYFVDTINQARAALEDVRSAFGSARWRVAQATMRDLTWHSASSRMAFAFTQLLQCILESLPPFDHLPRRGAQR